MRVELRPVTAVALAIALLQAACGDGERTREVQPVAEDPQITGDASYRAALTAYGAFDATAPAKLGRALSENPRHPRALALALFTNLVPDRAASSAALARAEAVVAAPDAELTATDRSVLRAAIACRHHGAKAGLAVLSASSAAPDHESVFWSAELAFRAGRYAVANRHLFQLLRSQRHELRGRILDRYTRVLLHFGDGSEALDVARDYRKLRPKAPASARLLIRSLIAAHALDEADRVLSRQPAAKTDDRLLALRGRLAAHRGQFSRAATAYLAAADAAPAKRRRFHIAAAGVAHRLAGDDAAVRLDLERCSKQRSPGVLCTWLAAVAADDPAARQGSVRHAATNADPTLLLGILQASAVMAPIGCLGRADAKPLDANAKHATEPTADALKASVSLHKRHYAAGWWLPLLDPITVCLRAGVAATTAPRHAAQLLAPVAKHHAYFSLALARVQAGFDRPAARKTAERVATMPASPKLHKAAASLAAKLSRVNKTPQRNN